MATRTDALTWSGSSGATSYQVYVADAASGAFTLHNTSTTAFSDSTVVVQPGSDPRLFQVVVRAVDSCGNKGPYAVGLMDVASSCP